MLTSAVGHGAKFGSGLTSLVVLTHNTQSEEVFGSGIETTNRHLNNVFDRNQLEL